MSHTYTKSKSFHICTFFLMLYFLFAPLEDLLTGSIGTIAKYIAIIVVFFGFIEFGPKNNLKLTLTKSNICIIWLMLIGVLSCIWAIDTATAIGRISAYLTVPGICLFVSMLEFSEKEYNAIVNAAIIGGVIAVTVVVVSNGASILTGERITLSENNDPNNLAALLLLPLCLSIGKLQTTSIKKSRIWYIVCIGVISFLFLLTGSRGGLLGLIAFFVAHLIFNKAYKRIYFLIGTLFVLLLIWFVVARLLPEDIVLRLFHNDDFVGNSATGGGRTLIWQTLFANIIPKNILIGVGAGCAPVALVEYFGYEKAVHNTYFNMLCEYGLFGLPVFLTLLYDKCRTQYKTKRYTEAALLIGICVIIFFLDSYAKKFFWNIIMLLIINEKVINRNKN